MKWFVAIHVGRIYDAGAQGITKIDRLDDVEVSIGDAGVNHVHIDIDLA